jgi:predicted SAM-dependent methyltransferase
MIANKIVGLNLGSRNRAIPGYLNMDIDQHEGVDIVGDISDLSCFEDGSVENIYASHVLEHFPHTKTLAVLKEWNRVLAPGGVLYVAVPDFQRTVQLYIHCGMNDWLRNYLWGDQGYKTAFHYTGFDAMSMTSILKEAGFSEVSRVANFPIGDIHDCSHIVSSFDGQSISLNCVAVK